MALTGPAARASPMRLTCDMLVLGLDSVVRDSDYAVRVRPLPFDAWEANDTSPAAPDFPGFQNSSIGGLEFMVTRITDGYRAAQYRSTARTWYLRFLPKHEPSQTTHALPLVVAITLSNPECQSPKHIDEPRWGNNATTGDMHRAFQLNDTKERLFIIKEGWKLGTPGKVWDSALVLSDMFSRRIIHEPKCLDRRHIIDLSAG